MFDDRACERCAPEWASTEPAGSSAGQHFRPLRLAQSLFADRLSFLQRALDELEAADLERRRLTLYAMEDVDPEIRKCTGNSPIRGES